MSPDQNGWTEYEKLVMFRLDALTSEVKELRVAQGDTHTEVVTLQAKASMWGAIAGFLSGFIGIFIRPKV